jgi:hypothetical protein
MKGKGSGLALSAVIIGLVVHSFGSEHLEAGGAVVVCTMIPVYAICMSIEWAASEIRRQ